MLESFNTDQWGAKLELNEFPEPEIIRLKYPILLCHGYGAIASLIKPSPLYDVAMLMRSHNVLAFAPNIVPYAKIETRAERWVEVIKKICNFHNTEKLNIIAHSMGGLDIRFALSELNADSFVASLTTVSTPHRGSSLAELALNTPDTIRNKMGHFLDWMGNHIYPDTQSDAVAAAEQLTRPYITNVFNPNISNCAHIPYYSYSAAIGKGTDHPVKVISRYQNNYIFEREGLNDGMVSVQSARWGEHIKTAAISHLEQMNLRVKDERKPLFEAFWLDVLKMLEMKGH